MSRGGELRLIAVVWAVGRPASFEDPAVEVSVLGSLAAIVGRGWRADDELELALRHDDVVAEVQERCRAVVPFRLGCFVRGERELHAMLRAQRPHLTRMLERFGGRVEMGLKLGMGGARLQHTPPGLSAIRALASRREDRSEQTMFVRGEPVLCGRYLIDRGAVGRFWSAFEQLRAVEPSVATLGSGPWAPYSFCEFKSYEGME